MIKNCEGKIDENKAFDWVISKTLVCFAPRTVWRSQIEWLAIGIENNAVIVDFNQQDWSDAYTDWYKYIKE